MDVSKVGATYGSFFNEPLRQEKKEKEGETGGLTGAREARPAGEVTGNRSEASLLSRVVQKRDHNVQLMVHKPTNRVVIKITDAETGEVINEIPRENYLDMVAHFLSNVERVHGLNLDEIV